MGSPVLTLAWLHPKESDEKMKQDKKNQQQKINEKKFSASLPTFRVSYFGNEREYCLIEIDNELNGLMIILRIICFILS